MPQSLKKGEVLRSRYKIREQIGQGGTGSIYLADDSRLEGRLCALKEVEHNRALPIQFIEQAREQFFREASVLARLDHPNIVPIYEIGEAPGFRWFTMQLIEGASLAVMLRKIAARPPQAFAAVVELSESVSPNWG